MLPKNRRISRRVFPYILSNSKRYNSLELLLYIAPIEQGTKSKESRVSFSVSKKIYSKAVDRNKRRRWGYSIISKNFKNIKSGIYLFFSFKKTPNQTTFSVLEKNITELLSISGVLI